MKKFLKVTAGILFLAFAGIQFVRPARTNPPFAREQTLEATTDVPESVANIFRKSCNDCHTNQTEWPWYSEIAPLSWAVAEHVEDGRRHLNFSEWGSYETRRRNKKLDEICEQVESREMPLSQYLWAHRDAKLTDSEINIVCAWTEASRSQPKASAPTPEQ